MPPFAIDHVIVACRDLEAACAQWRRLGLNASAGSRHPGLGTENAVVMLGDSAGRMFYVEFLAVHDRQQAGASARGRKLIDAIDAGGGMFRIVLGVADLPAIAGVAAAAGVSTAVTTVRRADGSAIGDVLSFGDIDEDSTDPRVIGYAQSREEAYAARRQRGLFTSSFGLDRLDHLALVPRDMETATRWWHDILGVPLYGEVRGSGMVIRQLKVGDAIVELLGPDGPDSRLAKAAAGLLGMIACEVSDLDAAVATARARGFNPTPAARGVLPGTRTATIPAAELGGVALQMLAYG